MPTATEWEDIYSHKASGIAIPGTKTSWSVQVAPPMGKEQRDQKSSPQWNRKSQPLKVGWGEGVEIGIPSTRCETRVELLEAQERHPGTHSFKNPNPR